MLSPEFPTGRVSWNRSIFKLIMTMIGNQQRFLFAVDANIQQTAEYEVHPKGQHTANIVSFVWISFLVHVTSFVSRILFFFTGLLCVQ